MATALVVSPTPPSQATRLFFLSRFGPAVEFADLAGLRRAGLGTLRRRRTAAVVATAPAGELLLFEDYLVLLAFLVPGARRERQIPGEDPVPLGWTSLLRSALRVAAGLVAGVAALAANGARAVRLRRRIWAPYPLAGTTRCLYLKPTLSFGASVGGSVAHVAGVANALARSGVAVRLLSAQEQPLIAPPCTQRVVPPHFLISFPFEVNPHRYQAVFLQAARKEAAANAPDFVYQRYALNDMSGLLLRDRLKLPLVLEFNGSEVWAQRHWGERLRFELLAESIERANLRQADLVVVVSEPLVEQAVSLGASRERVLFYPNGIDPHAFDPARFGADERRRTRETLGVPADADLLTFVGTFGTWHGTDVLASAIRRLIDADRAWLERHQLHFLYVGDGALAPRVRAILGDGCGAPFVTLAGMRPQAETPATLAASDILLSPHVPNPDGSPFFGSPTKLFEYMAMAKPIVASDLDQIGWVLKGWRPGEPAPAKGAAGRTRGAVLVDPGSVDALLAGIRRAVEMPSGEREALGAEARRLVTGSFTWDRNVAAVLDRLRAVAQAASVTGDGVRPLPAELGQVRDFWQARACGEVYAQGESLRDRLGAQARARYALEPYLCPFARFEDGRELDVLEIGVGMGADHLEWARHRPRSLTGVDLTPHAVELTRARLALQDLPSRLVVTDAERLPFRDASFDLVYSWGVIHHSPDTGAAVREIQRVLRPAGRARVMIYQHRSLVGVMLWLRYAFLAGRPWRSLREIYARHLESPGTKAYTPAEARAMFSGFEAVQLRSELSPGDLLLGAAGQRHRGILLDAARRLYPRAAVRRFFAGWGLHLLIEASRPLAEASEP